MLFERFGEVARPRLHLLEQTRVLDGDNGLVGEGLEQLDLPIGKWARLLAADIDGADRFAIAQHRHG